MIRRLLCCKVCDKITSLEEIKCIYESRTRNHGNQLIPDVNKFLWKIQQAQKIKHHKLEDVLLYITALSTISSYTKESKCTSTSFHLSKHTMRLCNCNFS